MLNSTRSASIFVVVVICVLAFLVFDSPGKLDTDDSQQPLGWFWKNSEKKKAKRALKRKLESAEPKLVTSNPPSQPQVLTSNLVHPPSQPANVVPNYGDKIMPVLNPPPQPKTYTLIEKNQPGFQIKPITENMKSSVPSKSRKCKKCFCTLNPSSPTTEEPLGAPLSTVMTVPFNECSCQSCD